MINFKGSCGCGSSSGCGCGGGCDGGCGGGCGCGSGNNSGCGCGGCGNTVRVHGCAANCRPRRRVAAFGSASNIGLLAVIAAGFPVTFNTPGPLSNIAFADPLFTVGLAGNYRVSVTVQTDLTSALGSIQVQRNALAVGAVATLATPGQPLTLTQNFALAAGDTIGVKVGGAGLTLPAGTNATITVTKL